MRHIYLNSHGEQAPSQKIRAVVMTKTELDRIKSHLQWQAKQTEDWRLRRTQAEQTKTASKNIVKHWKNTVLNKQKEREERRLKRIQDDEDRKNAVYLASLKQAAEDRKEQISQARRMILFDRDDIHQINSALIFSEVLKERAIQVEFNDGLKEIEKRKRQEIAEGIKRDVEVHRQQEEELKIKNHKDMLDRKAEYIKMMKEKAEHEALLLSSDKEHEKQDLIDMQKELQKVQSNIEEEIKRKKQHVLKDALDSIAKVKERERICKAEDEDEEKVNQIYLKVKHRIECLKKKKEAELWQAKLEKQEQIRSIIAAGMKEKQDDEDAMIAKALKEREEKELEKRKKQESYQARLVKERLDYFLETEERRKQETHEGRQRKEWELLQVMKRAEIDKMAELRRKESEWAKKMTVRQGYNSQIDERKELHHQEQEEDLEIFKMLMSKTQGEDRDFFNYAQEVLSDCKQMGRPLYPVQKAINDYRKKFGILWKEKNEKKIKDICDRRRLENEIDQQEEDQFALTVYDPPVSNLKCGPPFIAKSF